MTPHGAATDSAMETSSPPGSTFSPPPAPGAAGVGDDGMACTPLSPPPTVALATPGSPATASLTHLIVVAGHAVFHGAASPAAAAHPSAWTLAPFQATEAPEYIAHIQAGVAAAAADPTALLVFSGGVTRKGCEGSEAGGYVKCAALHDWWGAAATLNGRVATDTHARDSYENVLFSLAAFHTATGAYPATLTVVSWPFKRVRFGDHVATLRWPADRYAFVGVGVPGDAAAAEVGERATRRLFGEQPYGGWGVLWAKRLARSWGGQKVGGWGALDGLVAWRGPEPYPGALPWEEGPTGATAPATAETEAVPALGALSDGKGLAVKAAALAGAQMGAGPAAQGV